MFDCQPAVNRLVFQINLQTTDYSETVVATDQAWPSATNTVVNAYDIINTHHGHHITKKHV